MLLSLLDILDAHNSGSEFWYALRVREDLEDSLRWSLDVNRLGNGCNTNRLSLADHSGKTSVFLSDVGLPGR